MKFINKLEKKFGKYAIHGLIQYIIILYAMGSLIGMINPELLGFLNFDINLILKGEVWRIFTFIIQPLDSSNVFFLFFELYLYYMIGSSLENSWGTFRFNLYYFSGIVFNVLAVIIIYLITKLIPGGYALSMPVTLVYINRAMFLAFAALYPNVQFLLFFIIPIKVKYLAYLYAGIIGYDFIQYLVVAFKGSIFAFSIAISIIISLGNFLIFFFATRNYRRISPKEIRRRKNFKKHMEVVKNENHYTKIKKENIVTRHKCTVCGKTELDDYMLEFRFCSKCDGNYEYCMEHLLNHEHVDKQ